jgi:hypothetical protein
VRNSTIREVAKLDAAMEKDPPRDLTEDQKRRVMVAVEVHDPHRDSGHNGAKDACKWGHEFTEANTITRPDGRQCRTCKNKYTSEWVAKNPQVLTPEQRARKSELERLRRQQRKENAA